MWVRLKPKVLQAWEKIYDDEIPGDASPSETLAIIVGRMFDRDLAEGEDDPEASGVARKLFPCSTYDLPYSNRSSSRR